MKVFELLEEKFVLTDFKSYKKEDLINELIDLHAGNDKVTNLDDVRKAVLDREKIMSTGVGKGFAIPHGKTNAVSEVIASFGKTTNEIEYEALDGEPVHLVAVRRDEVRPNSSPKNSKCNKRILKPGLTWEQS